MKIQPHRSVWLKISSIYRNKVSSLSKLNTFDAYIVRFILLLSINRLASKLFPFPYSKNNFGLVFFSSSLCSFCCLRFPFMSVGYSFCVRYILIRNSFLCSHQIAFEMLLAIQEKRSQFTKAEELYVALLVMQFAEKRILYQSSIKHHVQRIGKYKFVDCKKFRNLFYSSEKFEQFYEVSK